MRWELRLYEKHTDGSNIADHLEVAARRRAKHGLTVNTQEEEIPYYPEELNYLREWVMELHGRSGASMAGLLPLSYPVLESWWRLKGCPEPLHPLEVHALIELDRVILDLHSNNPKKRKTQEEDKVPDGDSRAQHLPWPVKKNGS